MNRNLAAAAAALLVVAGGGYYLHHRARSHPSVTVTARITVTPAEQSAFVLAQGNSAVFKYLIGKEAKLAPALARGLTVRPVAGTSLLEAKVALNSQEEGKRFSEKLVPALQGLCGTQAQLARAENSLR